MIEVAIYRSLFTFLIEERVIDVSDPIFLEVLRWNEKFEETRTQLRETFQNDSNTIGLELQLTRPFARNLVQLAKRLSQ